MGEGEDAVTLNPHTLEMEWTTVADVMQMNLSTVSGEKLAIDHRTEHYF